MIKFRRTTRTVLIFEDMGEMHNVETETDVMMVLPKWAVKALKGAARIAYLAKLEIAVWKRRDLSLKDKIIYGYHAS